MVGYVSSTPPRHCLIVVSQGAAYLLGDTRAGGFLSIPPAYFPRGTMAEHHMTRLWRDPAFRARRTAAIRHGQAGDEFRAKRSKISKAQWSNEDYRNKIVTGLKATLKRPEVKARLKRLAKIRISKFAQIWFGIGPYVTWDDPNSGWD